MKLKKGDSIKVIRGKDKGKTGKIEKVFPKEKKVLVLGVNEYKRHAKATSQKSASEIKTITKPMPEANVAFVCPKCSKNSRIGFVIKVGKKLRICKKCKKEI